MAKINKSRLCCKVTKWMYREVWDGTHNAALAKYSLCSKRQPRLILTKCTRLMCNVKVKYRVPSKELRERLGIDDIILILQQNRLRASNLN